MRASPGFTPPPPTPVRGDRRPRPGKIGSFLASPPPPPVSPKFGSQAPPQGILSPLGVRRSSPSLGPGHWLTPRPNGFFAADGWASPCGGLLLQLQGFFWGVPPFPLRLCCRQFSFSCSLPPFVLVPAGAHHPRALDPAGSRGPICPPETGPPVTEDFGFSPCDVHPPCFSAIGSVLGWKTDPTPSPMPGGGPRLRLQGFFWGLPPLPVRLCCCLSPSFWHLLPPMVVRSVGSPYRLFPGRCCPQFETSVVFAPAGGGGDWAYNPSPPPLVRRHSPPSGFPPPPLCWCLLLPLSPRHLRLAATRGVAPRQPRTPNGFPPLGGDHLRGASPSPGTDDKTEFRGAPATTVAECEATLADSSFVPGIPVPHATLLTGGLLGPSTSGANRPLIPSLPASVTARVTTRGAVPGSGAGTNTAFRRTPATSVSECEAIVVASTCTPDVLMPQTMLLTGGWLGPNTIDADRPLIRSFSSNGTARVAMQRAFPSPSADAKTSFRGAPATTTSECRAIFADSTLITGIPAPHAVLLTRGFLGPNAIKASRPLILLFPANDTALVTTLPASLIRPPDVDGLGDRAPLGATPNPCISNGGKDDLGRQSEDTGPPRPVDVTSTDSTPFPDIPMAHAILLTGGRTSYLLDPRSSESIRPPTPSFPAVGTARLTGLPTALMRPPGIDALMGHLPLTIVPTSSGFPGGGKKDLGRQSEDTDPPHPGFLIVDAEQRLLAGAVVLAADHRRQRARSATDAVNAGDLETSRPTGHSITAVPFPSCLGRRSVETGIRLRSRRATEQSLQRGTATELADAVNPEATRTGRSNTFAACPSCLDRRPRETGPSADGLNANDTFEFAGPPRHGFRAVSARQRLLADGVANAGKTADQVLQWKADLGITLGGHAPPLGTHMKAGLLAAPLRSVPLPRPLPLTFYPLLFFSLCLLPPGAPSKTRVFFAPPAPTLLSPPSLTPFSLSSSVALTHTHTPTHVRTHTHTHTHTQHAHTHTLTLSHKPARPPTRTYCALTHTHTHTHTPIRTPTRAHTHTHTHSHARYWCSLPARRPKGHEAPTGASSAFFPPLSPRAVSPPLPLARYLPRLG